MWRANGRRGCSPAARLVREEPVDQAQMYFRCAPRFEIAAQKLAWMMGGVPRHRARRPLGANWLSGEVRVALANARFRPICDICRPDAVTLKLPARLGKATRRRPAPNCARRQAAVGAIQAR